MKLLFIGFEYMALLELLIAAKPAVCVFLVCLFLISYLVIIIKRQELKKKMCVALMHLIIFFSAVFCTLPDQPTRLSKTAA